MNLNQKLQTQFNTNKLNPLKKYNFLSMKLNNNSIIRNSYIY